MKFKEIMEKPATELDRLEENLRKELSDLRLQVRSGQLAETAKIGKARRDIARVLTVRKLKATPEELKGGRKNT